MAAQYILRARNAAFIDTRIGGEMNVFTHPGSHLAEPNQVHDVQRAAGVTNQSAYPTHATASQKKGGGSPDVIRTPSQELFPISRFPETEPFHLHIVVAHGGVAIRCSVQVEVDQLLQVCTHDLVRIDKDDLVEVHGEQDIQEEDLVCPDDSLFFSLWS